MPVDLTNTVFVPTLKAHHYLLKEFESNSNLKSSSAFEGLSNVPTNDILIILRGHINQYY
jgi:hypothetical protein